jgi:protein-tyrosine phosphatase
METAETRVPIKQFCFVCTGNLYRSKYAEACFNYLCIQNNITHIRAFSRGLRVQPTEKYEHGESFTFPIRLAVPSYKRIENRNIPFCLIGATNQMLDNYDCASSEKIILMNKDEHMPWMKKKHSDYLDKVECLEIGDKNYLPENGYDGPAWEIDDALDAIEIFVENFFKKNI